MFERDDGAGNEFDLLAIEEPLDFGPANNASGFKSLNSIMNLKTHRVKKIRPTNH
jgi:hypothetical protein